MDIEIRPASADDGPAAQAIVELAFANRIARIGRRPAPMDQDYVAEFAKGDAWAAVRDGEVLGFVLVRPRADHLLVDTIAVSPGAHGAGIGTRLLERAERHAVELGLPEVRLYTNEAMTENLAWYARRGYAETHRRESDGFRRVHFAKRVAGG